MKRIFIYLIITSFIFTLTRCAEDEVKVDPTEGLVKLSDGYALGAAARLELWGSENYFVGFNKITAVLYDSLSNQRITDAHILFSPEMSMMGGMKHACPVENPEEESVNEGFPGAVEFIMPTSDMGSWKLKVIVNNHLYNKSGSANFDIVVNNPTTAKVKSFVTEANEKIFIGYYFPDKMKVGVNTFEVTAYQMVSAYEFTPVENFTISLTPEMPSMGHGSPNNVDPVYSSGGHYKGKVNFTMTGDWRLNLLVSRNGSAMKELYFDVTLE